jgi:hypothetical protein
MRFLSCLLLTGIITSSLYAQTRPCPPCYYNYRGDHLGIRLGQEVQYAQDGRKIVKVRIDSSWNQSYGHTTDKIWNATAGCPQCSPPIKGAIDRWNEAKDSNGDSIPYKFVIDQGDTEADIVIVKESVLGGYAEIDLSRKPHKLSLDPRNANIDVESVAGRIAHEIGHPLGLNNAETACGGNSIMSEGQTTETGVRTTTKVTPSDAAAVRRNRYTTTECTDNFNSFTGNEECADSDGDGWSTCAGDCDDGNTFLTPSDNDGDGCSSCDGDPDDARPYMNCSSGYTYTQSYCYDYYLVTDHYECGPGGGCMYMYSSYQYMGSQCYLTE